MERENNLEEGQIRRPLLVAEKTGLNGSNGWGDAEAAAGDCSFHSPASSSSSSSASSTSTVVVALSTCVVVSGSLAYGFAAGYSSAAKAGMMEDLGLSTAEYSVFGSMLTIGGMIGSIVSGKLADLIGRRITMWWSGIFFILGWLAIIFAKAAWWIDVGRFVLGLGVGIHCYVAPAYIGEITVKNTRGGYTAANQLMLSCGLSVVYFIGNLVPWRTLAIIGTIPSLVEIVGIFFIPESPRWLAKIGKEKEFEAALKRLRGQNADISEEATQILEYKKIGEEFPKSRFLDLFQRKYAHSLIIGVGLVLLAVFGGTVAVSYYAGSIFAAAGCSVAIATTVMSIIQVPFSILGVYLTDKAGRRPLWMISAAGTLLGNFLAGLGFLLQDLHQSKELTSILVFVGIMIFVSSFSAGMSGIHWVVVSEILPIDIKGSAGSLVIFANWASAWVISYFFNFVLLWSSTVTFFFSAGVCALTVLFVAKVVPETKGRTLEEIQASLTLFQELRT